MSAGPPRFNATQPSNERQLLLEEAAGVIDRRIGAIRSGTAPLHVVLELECAARAIRSLATELDRLREGRAAGDDRCRPSSAHHGPPVLERVVRRRGPVDLDSAD